MKRRAERDPQRERWIQIIGFSILGGITLGLLIDRLQEPVRYVKEAHAETTEIIEEDKTVLIEVKIDWTKERIEQEVRNTFPEEPNTAVAVAIAESGLNPNAYNPEAHRGCHGSVGIMQIGCVHYKKDPRALHDIQFNLQKARAIYDDSKARTGNGWLPWGAYTDGRYKQYLD